MHHRDRLMMLGLILVVLGAVVTRVLIIIAGRARAVGRILRLLLILILVLVLVLILVRVLILILILVLLFVVVTTAAVPTHLTTRSLTAGIV